LCFMPSYINASVQTLAIGRIHLDSVFRSFGFAGRLFFPAPLYKSKSTDVKSSLWISVLLRNGVEGSENNYVKLVSLVTFFLTLSLAIRITQIL
jgi:hypothetical protein